MPAGIEASSSSSSAVSWKGPRAVKRGKTQVWERLKDASGMKWTFGLWRREATGASLGSGRGAISQGAGTPHRSWA